MNVKEFAQMSARRYNARSLAGLTLRNATGDIAQTSLGYQIAIDTLTFIKKQITEQKFYEVAPADYVPISVGDGAFTQNILTNLVVSTAGDFESGIINAGSANDRLASADVGIGSVTVRVMNWAKAVGYSVFEIEQALQANNWDIIESKHRARKKNWDLGIQKVAFLGSLQTTGVAGLLTQSGVNSDTTTLTNPISSLSAAQFSNFVAAVVAAYRANCNYTAYPTHFVIPESDYLGLVSPISPSFPINSKLEYLLNAFKAAVPGGVKVLPSVYCQSTYNSAYSVNLSRYVMYRYDPESIRMDIPVDYTVTQANTWNNFQFQDAAYGQFTGVGVYRNLEVLYFDF